MFQGASLHSAVRSNWWTWHAKIAVVAGPFQNLWFNNNALFVVEESLKQWSNVWKTSWIEWKWDTVYQRFVLKTAETDPEIWGGPPSDWIVSIRHSNWMPHFSRGCARNDRMAQSRGAKVVHQLGDTEVALVWWVPPLLSSCEVVKLLVNFFQGPGALLSALNWFYSLQVPRLSSLCSGLWRICTFPAFSIRTVWVVSTSFHTHNFKMLHTLAKKANDKLVAVTFAWGKPTTPPGVIGWVQLRRRHLLQLDSTSCNIL